MSIIKMKKVAVIGLDTVKEKLISDLMELGVVQITDQGQKLTEDDRWKELGKRDGDEEMVSAMDLKINRASLALETLEKYSTEKSPLFFTRRAMKRADFAKTLEGQEQIYKDIDRVLALKEDVHKLKEAINKKNAELSSIKPWVVYDVPLEVTETKYTSINLGVVPSAADMDVLTGRVYDGREAVGLKEVSRDRDLIYLVAITLKEEQEDVLSILKQHGYTPVPFAGFTGTAEANRDRIIKEIQETEAKCGEVEKEISTLSGLKSGIECLYDEMVMERDLEK